MPLARLFLAVRCSRRKTTWKDAGDVDDRGHDREWEGGDDPTARTAEPQPAANRRPRPAAAVPLVVWPRAAGGGAGAVAAPVAGRHRARQTSPRRARDGAGEPATEPPRSRAIVRPDEPAVPHRARQPRRARLQQPSMTSRRSARRMRIAPEPTQPARRETLQSHRRCGRCADRASASTAGMPVALQPVASSSPFRRRAARFSAATATCRLRARTRAGNPPRHGARRGVPPSTPAEVEPPRILRRALRLAASGSLPSPARCSLLIILYRWVDPPASTLMLGQRLAGTPIIQRWVPLTRISPNLPAGGDPVRGRPLLPACRRRLGRAEGGHREHRRRRRRAAAAPSPCRWSRTCSCGHPRATCARPSRSRWPTSSKWPGPSSASSRSISISRNGDPACSGPRRQRAITSGSPPPLLGPREAALLAVSLPNPFERDAGAPGPGTQRLADNLLLRMRAARATAGCARARPAGDSL